MTHPIYSQFPGTTSYTEDQPTDKPWLNSHTTFFRFGKAWAQVEVWAVEGQPKFKVTTYDSAWNATTRTTDDRTQVIEWVTVAVANALPGHRRGSSTGKCDNCGGDGTYKWGGSVNGVPVKTGRCFRCNGKGTITEADDRRNWGYDNFYRRVSE